MKQNINIEAEGSELILKNKAGDHVIIPKKYRTEVQGMIKDGCHGCIDSLVETLPIMADYAEDGSLVPAIKAADGLVVGKDNPPKKDIPPTYTFVDDKNDERYIQYSDSLYLYNNNSYKGTLTNSNLLNKADINSIHGDYMSNWKNVYDKNKLSMYVNNPKYTYQKLPINNRMFRPVTLGYTNLSNDFNTYKPPIIKNSDTYIENKDGYIREHRANYPYIIHNTIKPIAWVDGPYYPKPTHPVFLKGTKEYDNAKKQEELQKVGLYTGKIDGIWGDKSKAALKEYEKIQEQKINTPQPVINQEESKAIEQPIIEEQPIAPKVTKSIGKYWGRYWKSTSGINAPSDGGYYYIKNNTDGSTELLTPDEYKKLK